MVSRDRSGQYFEQKFQNTSDYNQKEIAKHKEATLFEIAT
jgi:hypothetical protein